MSMRKICWLLAIMALMGLGIATSWAQQDNTPTGQVESTTASPTSPSGPSQTPVNAPNPSQGQAPAPAPMPPLSGVQVLAPTFGTTSEDYFVPALACTELASTDPTGLNRNSGLFSETSCAGKVTLQRVDKRTQLNLDFTGGSYFYDRPINAGTTQNIKRYGTAEELSVFEQVNGRRWNWMVGDQGTYLPEGSLGYSEFAGLSSFAGGMGGGSMASAPALNGAFSPNQSIYGGVARRFSDLATSEFNYLVGPRTTLTATAMFGTQRFLTPGYIDDRYWVIMTGFNRTFGRSNEFAVSYDEMHFNFGASQQGMLTRGASILYGRQVSPKLSVQVSVAPMAREISVPQAGSATSFFLGTADSVKYRALRWDGSLTFDRTLSGGSGYLAGAERTMLMAMMGRQLSRRVHGSLNMAYANNRSVAQTSSGVPRPSYDYVLAGVNLTHELGRHVSMYVNYSVQRQTANTPLCEGTTCSTVYFRQIGGVGINWHAQPIKIH